MIIPQEKIQEIALANDLVEVIGSYVAVKKRGKSYIALCPFHPDKNPSLHISQEKQVYHCFACKAGGNVFSFVQEFEKITFFEAAELLARRAGIDIIIRESSVDLSNEISKLYEINRIAAKYFNSNLEDISGGEREYVYRYLKNRQISKEVIKRFGIGYASNNWESFKRHSEDEKIFSKEDLEKAGLLIKAENNSYYDRFRGRIIFPVFSENGKVVAFGGRKIYEDDPTGKYINSPESKIYNKSRILYGLNFSKEFIRAKDSVILVEGYMDFISMFEAGVKNVVASSGTSLTEEQVKLISRYTNNIHILFDADLAGIKAAKRSIEIILNQNMELSVITLPEGEDPDSMIKKFGTEEFSQYVEKRKNIINFISSLYEKENKLESVADKTQFIKEIINYICCIPDKINRAFQMKELSRLYGLYESDLRTELENVLNRNYKERKVKSSLEIPVRKKITGNKNGSEINQLDRDILEVFIKGNREALKFLEDKFDIGTIKNPALIPVFEKFLDELMYEEKVDIGKVLNSIENEEIKSVLSEISNEEHGISTGHKLPENSLIVKSEKKKINYLKKAQDVVRNLEIRHLEGEIELLKSDISNLNKISNLKKEVNKLKLNK